MAMELLSFALYHEGDEQHGRLPPSNPSSLPPTAEEEEEEEEKEEEGGREGKENKSSSNRRRRRRAGRKSGGSEATDEEEDEEEEGSEGGSPFKKGGGKKARTQSPGRKGGREGGDVRGDLFLSRLNAALQAHGDGLSFAQFVELLNDGLEEGGREGGLFSEEEALRLVVAQDGNGKCYWEENGQVIYSS